MNKVTIGLRGCHPLREASTISYETNDTIPKIQERWKLGAEYGFFRRIEYLTIQ
jgi:hypothetical protein